MSEIFISYASADRDRARMLAEALTERGWKVWWDRTIPPGRQFDEVIEEALDASQCVVVLWSNASVTSTWVKTEAAEAMRRKILVPALIDDVKIPLEFRRLQAADLSNWKGERSHEELLKFLQSIESNVGHGGSPPPPAPADPPPPRPELRPEPAPTASALPPAPRPKSNATAMAIAGIVALVVAAVGYTAYSEYAKRVALEEKAEKERRAADEARRAAEQSAARAKAAQEEAARQAAQRRIEDQRRAAEDAARATREKADRERLAREKAERDRAEQERIARENAERERLAREKANREQADRAADKQRAQKSASRLSSLKLAWHDHALRFTGVLNGSGSGGTLRATIWDIRNGDKIGDYDVPVKIVQPSPTEYVVSGSFAIPGDSVTPTPHTHTSRLHLRSDQDGTLRFIQNCPRPEQCFAAK